MTEAWFCPQTANYFSFLSLLSLCALFGIPARRGQFRGLTMGVWNIITAFGVLLFAAGVFAVTSGQPPDVSRTLLLAGFLVVTVFAFTRRGLARCYTEAELRRSVAADL